MSFKAFLPIFCSRSYLSGTNFPPYSSHTYAKPDLPRGFTTVAFLHMCILPFDGYSNERGVSRRSAPAGFEPATRLRSAEASFLAVPVPTAVPPSAALMVSESRTCRGPLFSASHPRTPWPTAENPTRSDDRSQSWGYHSSLVTFAKECDSKRFRRNFLEMMLSRVHVLCWGGVCKNAFFVCPRYRGGFRSATRSLVWFIFLTQRAVHERVDPPE